jgi:hypothetical protein
VPTSPLAQIEVARKICVGSAERDRRRVRPFRHCNQMDVIGHEAIGQHAQSRSFGIGFQQIKVELIITSLEKYLLTSVAPLRDVVGDTLQDDSGDAGHRRRGGSVEGILSGLCLSVLSRKASEKREKRPKSVDRSGSLKESSQQLCLSVLSREGEKGEALVLLGCACWFRLGRLGLGRFGFGTRIARRRFGFRFGRR